MDYWSHIIFQFLYIDNLFSFKINIGNNSFGYDNEGQLSSGYGSTYSFDYEHRLTAAGNASYTYDGAGNRLQAVRNGVTTRYVYDASGNLLCETDGSNNITRYYIYGKGLVAMVTPTDNVYCYHYNGTGSTVAVTDANQNIVNKYAYDPFGNISQQETISQPFKYVGQFGVMSEPNGFYYMRARYYDPNVGRFIREDPKGFGGGDTNLMAYVLNNPVNFIDPLGLFSFHQFLINSTTDFGIAGTASALVPGTEPAAPVFFGLAAVSAGLDIAIYSDSPYLDTLKESIKMALPVKEPYNLFTDKAVDEATEKIKESAGNKSNCNGR